ncbi:hypothetical protein DPMN_066213 [Dreissena polymorpha]|uniref:Uncharacterized protein n=1 Tax=Dreissena polymorpha TaxID=45954 RepID=A0A9D3YT30_DREPO|nr:hypothetical protein DPMN_066213 [Dreissena polymorpha]
MDDMVAALMDGRKNAWIYCRRVTPTDDMVAGRTDVRLASWMDVRRAARRDGWEGYVYVW